MSNSKSVGILGRQKSGAQAKRLALVKRGLAYAAVTVLSVVLAAPAMAAYECNVKVVNVLIYQNGFVNILHSGRGDYTGVCNLTSTWKGVEPTTCAMWAGLLQQVKKKSGSAQVYFDGNGSCATLPTYGDSPAPVYIGDVTP